MASTSSRPASRAGRSRSQSRSRSRANSRGAGDQDGYGSGDSAQDDFCNAFWESGQADDPQPGQERGYESLMARTKSAGRMVDDLRAFFKERYARQPYAFPAGSCKLTPVSVDRSSSRELLNVNSAAIEEDYARRLAKLARMPLGKDETGYRARPATSNGPRPY